MTTPRKKAAQIGKDELVPRPEIAATLLHLAAKYLWWKSPEEAVQQPERVVARVMDMGDWDDVQMLANEVGDEYLREVLTHAEAGQYNERSWAYWHYRLGLAEPGKVPAMPRRRTV